MSSETIPSPLQMTENKYPVDIANIVGQTEQLFNIVRNFGAISTATAIYRKYAVKEDNTVRHTMLPEGLKYPLLLRSTLSDMYGYTEIFNQDIYKLPEKLMRHVGSKAIVDVGAYNGTSSTYLASKYPDSRVIAIEPNKNNFELLDRNATPYGEQIRRVHAAVMPDDRPVDRVLMGATPDSMLYAYIPGDESVSHDSWKTPSLTPEDILELTSDEQIGILKVDIEGAEKEFFQSKSIGRLLQNVGILLVETHEQFIPGSERSVNIATTVNRFTSITINRHTKMYVANSNN